MMRPDVLDLIPVGGGAPLGPLGGPKVWSEASLPSSEWLLPVSAAVLDELEAVVDALGRRRLPIYLLRSDDFDLPASTALMSTVRDALVDGHGFAILDRLPVDEWSVEDTRAVGWLLGSLLSQPVAQTPGGQIFHDVRDEGTPDGRGLSLGLTSTRLDFHQDNSGNRLVPDHVCLLPIHTARVGGMSEYATLASVRNALAEDAPELLARLVEPYFHDRLGFEAPGEPKLLWAPALTWDGHRLVGRFSPNKISQGYEWADIELSDLDRASLDAVPDAIRLRQLSARHLLEPGQAFYFNNAEGLHHREPYEDGPGTAERRHLVRMWFREAGRAYFDG